MTEKKTWIRFFSIADYEEEELWLRSQHQRGWKLHRMIIPCFYIFERCTPEDVVYRLDYKNATEDGEYMQIFRDYGWEYCGQCSGWLYFRKSVSEMGSEQEGEIFSDEASKVDMIDHIVKTRMLPLLIIFFACVIPQFFMALDRGVSGWLIFWVMMLALYLYLFIHCGGKLRRLKEKFKNE